MNADKVALKQWIIAGLQIPEVRDGFGDSGYLLGNMIAKYSSADTVYSISTNALEIMKDANFDLTATHARGNKFLYGKKTSPFVQEHQIPTNVIRRHLLSLDNSQAINAAFNNFGSVSILTREEDQMLKEHGLNKDMPADWKWGDNPLSRYQAAGIKISNVSLNVKGALKR